MIFKNFDDLFADIDINTLATLPRVILVFLDAAHTEAVTFERLSELIKKDASSSKRIVAAANTAYYAGQVKSLSFEWVLALLGLHTIKTIAITASVQQFFSRFDSASVGRQKAFWRDSLTCAQLAASLARLTGYAYEEETYLVGPIRNIGSLIFANNHPDQYAALADNEVQLAELESEHFGGTRYQSGAWIVSSWDMESFVADAVLYQNQPLESLQGAHHLVKILAVASRLSQTQHGADDLGLAAAQQVFDLSESMAADLLAKTRREVMEMAQSMQIDLEPLEGAIKGQISAIHEAKQVELAGKVRDIALLSSIRQDFSRSDDKTSIKQAIQSSLRILFNCQAGLFFKVSAEGKSLKGDPLGETDQKLTDFDVAIVPESSLLARCFIEKRVLHSLSTDSSLPSGDVDRQLIRLAGGKLIVCLPLMIDDHQRSVLVVGVKTLCAVVIERQLQLWKMIANEASYSLLTQQQHELHCEGRNEEDREYYQARACEIVHEVNNPLSIVKNYVYILSTRLNAKDVALEELRIIREELERAGSILLRPPNIAEQGVASSGAELVNVNTLIADLMTVFRASLFASSGIEAVTEYDGHMVPIVSSRSAIK